MSAGDPTATTAADAGRPAPPTPATGRTFGAWIADHAVEIVFGLLVLGAFAYSLRITSGAYFYADEWRILDRSQWIGRVLEPYNSSLSVVTMLLDRALAEIFGLGYTSFRVVGLLALYAVPLTYFLTTRSRFGAVLAAFLAFPLLWYGHYVSLMPSEHNHNIALLGGIVAAAALTRGRRADGVLAVALLVALGAAGGGVAVAAACIVHCACTRAPLRRWIAVLVPLLLWVVWWVVEVGHADDRGAYAMTFSQTVTFVRRLAFTAFLNAGFGSQWLGYALVVAFVAVGVLALRQGLRAGANFLAWSTAAVVWAVGLANNRGVFADIHVFRYRYGALAFLLLAIVPARPLRWPARFPITSDRRWIVAGAALVLVLGVARGVWVRSDLRASASALSEQGRISRAQVDIVRLGPGVLSDRASTGGGIAARLGGLTAGQVRRVLTHYGEPVVDRDVGDRLLARRQLSWRHVPAGSGPCTPIGRPITVTYRSGPGYAPVTVAATDTPVTVASRRFGRAWVPLLTLRPGEAAHVAISSDGGMAAGVPWQLQADGGCRVGATAG